MAGVKKFQLGGVDLRSNDLVRDPMRASDSRNVTKTLTGDLDKRHGYQAVETAGFELEESCYYKTQDTDVFIKSDGTIWKLYNGVRQSCSIASLFPNVGLVAKNRIIYTEYLNNLYITTSDGKSPVVKYDGSDAYLAGLPAPQVVFANSEATISAAGAGFYYRFFYSFKDLNGNITFGPYKQMTSTVNNATITVSSFKIGNPHGSFYNKYMTVGYANPATPVQYAVTSVNNFLYAFSTNYVVGDILMIDVDECPYINTLTGAKRKFINLTITAIQTIAANIIKITFDSTQLVGISFNVAGSVASSPIDCRLKLRSFRSTNQSFGYIECSPVSFTAPGDISGDGGFIYQIGQPIDNSANDQASVSIVTSPFFYYVQQKFENVYNEDGQKLRPPLCKYITTFGSQLIFGGIVGFWNQINSFSQYNAPSLLSWSDTGIADNGETNSAFIQKIGEVYDGDITGLKRCNDSLVITKTNSLFSINGVIAPGSYSLRKIPTNYIGCRSHNSILQTEEGIIFNGTDGIYFSDGVSANKLTSIIDPFFTLIDSTSSRSTFFTNERAFVMYMNDGTNHYILAYKYEFKEWFIWSSLDCTGGIYQKNNKDVMFAKNSGGGVYKTYKFNTGYSDDGVAISAYYKANWEDLRMPAEDKKFKSIRIWNLNSVSSSFNLTHEKNWANGVLDTTTNTVACTIPAYGTIQKFHNQRTVHSLRYVFSNNVLNQGMLITGYEVQYEPNQNIDKGN